MDPAVLRQIEKDLNKLARRRNERERAKWRKDQKDAKDSDRATSRFSGANKRIVHVPLATAGALHERRGSFGAWAGVTTGHPGDPTLRGPKRGSFASVAFGVGSSDEEDHASDAPGSTARSTASEELEEEMFASIMRRRSSAGRVRKEDLPKDQARADEVDPKSVMDYMAVMSEFLSSKGVHGSLLEDMETAEEPGDDELPPPMHRTASEVEAAASLATLQRGDSMSPSPE
jgi:hypothetical protein